MKSVFDYLTNDDLPRIVFHGTTTAHGLDIGDSIIPAGKSGNSTEQQRKKNNDIIFLSDSKKYARIYSGRARRIWGGRSVVYTVVPLNLRLFKQQKGMNIYTADGGFIIDQEIID